MTECLGSEERFKMTKWDRPEDMQRGVPSRSSLEAAAEAAAKVNAMLIAKGKLKPSQLSNAQQSKQKNSQGQSNLEMAEVDINDVPISCRNLLTRGSTQDEISKMSGAAVSTRGRYMAPEERMQSAPGDRPLYLCVQGPSQESVDKAVGRIREIIANSYRSKNAKFAPRMPGPPPLGFTRPRFAVMEAQGPPPPLVTGPTPPPLMSLNTQPAGITLLQEKLLIGLEHAPPSFDVKNKMLGPGGTFLLHIQNETGAKVTLHGKASGFLEPTGREAFEPMHVLIQHPTLPSLQQAKQLAENLIQTVQQDYAQFQQALATMPPPISPGTATLLAGVPQQTGPPPGAPPPGPPAWTVPQPGLPCTLPSQMPPQMPPPGMPSIGQPQVALSYATNEVRPVLTGVYTQPIPQTVLVNTSIPPPNFITQPQTSSPHTLPPGTTITVGPPMSSIAQPHAAGPPQQMNFQPGGPPPPQYTLQVSQPAGAPQVATLQAQAAQPGVVHVTGIPHSGGTPFDPQVTLTQTGTVLTPAHQTTVPGLVQTVPTVQPLQPGQQMVQPPPQQGSHPQQQLVTLQQVTLAAPPPHVVPPGATMPPPGASLPPGTAMIPGLAMPQGVHIPQGTQMNPGAPISIQGPTGQTYYKQYVAGDNGAQAEPITVKKERPHKRRFTEEKQEDKLPDNLLGYQHGPPHLANVVGPQSSQQALGHHENNDPERPEDQDPAGVGSHHGAVVTDSSVMPPPLPPISLLEERGHVPPLKKTKNVLGLIGSECEEEKLEVDERMNGTSLQAVSEPGFSYSQYTQQVAPVSSSGQQPIVSRQSFVEDSVDPSQPVYHTDVVHGGELSTGQETGQPTFSYKPPVTSQYEYRLSQPQSVAQTPVSSVAMMYSQSQVYAVSQAASSTPAMHSVCSVAGSTMYADPSLSQPPPPPPSQQATVQQHVVMEQQQPPPPPPHYPSHALAQPTSMATPAPPPPPEQVHPPHADHPGFYSEPPPDHAPNHNQPHFFNNPPRPRLAYPRHNGPPPHPYLPGPPPFAPPPPQPPYQGPPPYWP